jgi:hypothetical protein
MIIMVRGNHGSGKSTAVRNFMKFTLATPLFGALGFKAPEAYCCLRKSSPDHVKGPPTFVLGPYQTSATCGFDYITKLGVKAATEFLEKYRAKKGHVVFESIMTSVRILEPSIGKWIAAHKDELTIVTLTTTFEECEASIADRKTRSTSGASWNNKHLVAQQVMFERVTSQYEERGFRMEYVNRESAPEMILGLL